MTEVVRIGQVNDLPVGAAMVIEAGERRICVARCVDGYHAIDDRCSHEDESLSEGNIDPDNLEIECWKHGSIFSLETGEAITLPATQPVQVFEVDVHEDEVSVVVP